MTEWLAAVGLLSLVAGSFGAGYWVAMRQAARRAFNEAERMSRITGEPFHGGEPHNFNGPPARTSQGRIRNRRNWTNQN
jgi:hypothetical protein